MSKARTKRLAVKVSTEEHEIIVNNAKANGKSISLFVREKAMLGKTVKNKK